MSKESLVPILVRPSQAILIFHFVVKTDEWNYKHVRTRMQVKHASDAQWRVVYLIRLKKRLVLKRFSSWRRF
jgi:hypothetical protein